MTPYPWLKTSVLLTLLCLFFAIKVQAQKESNSSHLNIAFEYSDNYHYRNIGIGISPEFFLNDHWAVNYKALAGVSSLESFYFHAPAGAVIGGTILGNLASEKNGWTYLGIALILVPEGVSYYFAKDGSNNLAIYCSPFGYDYWYQYPDTKYGRFSGELGMRFQVPMRGKISALNMHVGLRSLYFNNNQAPFYRFHSEYPMLLAGLSVGLHSRK